MTPADAARRRRGGTVRVLVRELGAFGVVGASCFVIDVALFQVLYAHAGLGAVSAKALSTLTAMTIAYAGHRFWSFSHRARTGVRREYLLFGLVNGLTLLLNVGIVALVRYPLGQESALVLQVANLVGIGLGTVIRYLSYRQWVFPSHDSAAAKAYSPTLEASSHSPAATRGA